MIPKLKKVVNTSLADIEKKLKEFRWRLQGDILRLSSGRNVGTSAKDRGIVYAGIEKQTEKLKKQLAQINRSISELSMGVADERFKKDGIDIHFSKKRAKDFLDLISSNTESFSATYTDKMKDSVVRELQNAVVSTMAESAINGYTLREINKKTREKWEKSCARIGESAQFTDASGKVWDSDRYFQMNTRTNAMRVFNERVAMDSAEMGNDLVMISSGGDPNCPLCFPWEGRIVSVTGKDKDFPSLDEARAAGIFHPNCTHTIEYLDSVADKEEIDLQRGTDKPPANGTPDEMYENKKDLDIKRYQSKGMNLERAEIAVARDYADASIRNGLATESSAGVISRLTDAQIKRLTESGHAPEFAATKRGEAEVWNKGKNGGVIHIDRNTTAKHLVDVCGLNPPKVSPTVPTPKTPAPKKTAPGKQIVKGEFAFLSVGKAKPEERKAQTDKIRSVMKPKVYKDFGEEAFADIPDVLLNKMSISVKGIKSGGGGSLAQSDGIVKMGVGSMGWGYNKDTLCHEMSHCCLHDKINNGTITIEQRKSIVMSAQAETRKFALKYFGENWKRTIPSVNWYASCASKVTKGKLKEADYYNWDRTSQKLGASVSDLMCSSCYGDMFGGHPRYYYYRDLDYYPVHEIVAQVGALSSRPDGRKILMEEFPETTKKVFDLVFK